MGIRDDHVSYAHLMMAICLFLSWGLVRPAFVMTERYNDGVAFGGKGERESPRKGKSKTRCEMEREKQRRKYHGLPGWVL